MRIEAVDERDSSWENHDPCFRVYFFDGGDAPCHSWATDTYDVTEADVLEVVRWAQDRAGDTQLYAIALVTEKQSLPEDQRRGLIWLVGMDANDDPRHGDSKAASVLKGMFDRRAHPVLQVE